jgi:hypothetical protein
VLFGELIEGMYAEVPAAEEAGQAARSEKVDQGVHP